MIKYSDDQAVIEGSKGDLLKTIDRIVVKDGLFGMRINVTKTKLLGIAIDENHSKSVKNKPVIVFSIHLKYNCME